ncbi:LytTR family transcriptional regulator [Rhodovulum tesquicola]|uniref:LytTR family DNA-binding domain-containing protein n=1 Tax=Rhodovulum tesquicola TaxID=540254 RepID=UPI002096ED9F|nr:LytTR family DNA-binding domain-containing protein [Rhodovulum tesquicola]MCO8144196.1 LytTR family transcriptional regulator [Rhodovulum tesquicola]
MSQEFGRVLFHPSTLLLWIGLSLLLALGGPFGTYAASLSQRLAFWPLVVGAGLAGGAALRVVLRHHLCWLGFWQRALVKAGVLTAVLAVPVFRMAEGLGPEVIERDATKGIAEAALGVFGLSMGLSALHIALARRREAATAGADCPLLRRLPAERRGAVIRLSSSDHYVQVVTERGTTPILIRFADAIAELGGVEGLRVHRSHWVALDAVTGARRSGGRLFLTLSDGTELPVSRRHRAEVEALGLAPGASEAEPPASR